MATQVQQPEPPKQPRTDAVPLLARLTHPLVFFGLSILTVEGTIGTALFVGDYEDPTVIILCCIMALVVLAAMGTVALLVFKAPESLMLTAQDGLRNELDAIRRSRVALQVLLDSPAPKTTQEAFRLLDRIESAITRSE